jgi:hypothetical protein
VHQWAPLQWNHGFEGCFHTSNVVPFQICFNTPSIHAQESNYCACQPPLLEVTKT